MLPEADAVDVLPDESPTILVMPRGPRVDDEREEPETDDGDPAHAIRRWAGVGAAVVAGLIASLFIERLLRPIVEPPQGDTTTVDATSSPGDSTSPETPVEQAVDHRDVAPAEATRATPAVEPTTLSERERAMLRELSRDIEEFDEENARPVRLRLGNRHRSPETGDVGDTEEPTVSQPSPESKEPWGAPSSAKPKVASVSGQATLKFWDAMNAAIETEAGMRAPPAAGIAAGNAADFQRRRIAAGQYAETTLAALDRTRVDTDVVALCERIRQWYAEGVTICERGKFLLEKADASTRKGPQGREWQEADKAHQERVNSLNHDGEQVRRQMESRYRVAFPPLK